MAGGSINGLNPALVNADPVDIKVGSVSGLRILSNDGSTVLQTISPTGVPGGSATNAITAFAGGGQASAVLLTTGLNRISVCATANDSVKLPVPVIGATVVVENDGATTAAIFGNAADTVGGYATTVAYPLPAGQAVTLVCLTATTWQPIPATTPLQTKFTLIATAGPYVALAGELTGAQYVVNQYSGIAGSTLTTRTAVLMIADAGLKVGQSYNVRILNSNGATCTLTAGVGVTVTGHAAILTNTAVDYVVTVPTATTMVFQSVGTVVSP